MWITRTRISLQIQINQSVNGKLITSSPKEVKGGRRGEGEGREKDGREMEGHTYKGREVKLPSPPSPYKYGGRGKRERQGPPVIAVSPGI